MPSPSLDAWHSSGWTGSFVSLCLPSFVSRCLPAWMPGTALWVDAFVCLPGFTCLPLSSFICLPLSPSLDDPVWVDGSICLPLSFVSRCLPAWMPGTALWVDGFICLPLSPFICLPAWMPGAARVHLSPFVSLHLSPVVSQPGCLSPFIWLLLSPSLEVCHGSPGGRIHLSPLVPLHLSPISVRGRIHCFPLSPFICLPLSPSLDAWHGSLGGRIHLSPVVSQPGCVALTLRGFLQFPRFCPFGGVWFAFGFGPGFGHSLSCGCWRLPCLSLATPCLFVQCLVISCGPELTIAVRCGARLQLREGSVNPVSLSLHLPDGFICLPLSPFIWPRLSPSLDACHGSLGWRGSFVSLCLDAWHGSLGGRDHLSPFVSLHLSPVVSQPGCLARLSGWTGSFVSLCLPSFVLWALFPFICLPLSPSLDVWHGSPGGQIHLSPFVSLHLSPVVSQPGCLARLFGWTVSLVSLCLPSFGSPCLPAWMSVTALQADGFTCLPWFPFICLPSLWVDGLICLPLSPFFCLPLSPSLDASLGGRIHLSPFVSLCLSPPSLDAPLGGRIHLSPVVSQPGCVALTLRGFLHFPRFCPFGGVWFAFGFGPGFGHSLSCGCWGQGPLSALHLDFDFAWARGGSSSLSIVGYTLSVRSVPRYQLRSRADDSGEGSVNPPVKQT